MRIYTLASAYQPGVVCSSGFHTVLITYTAKLQIAFTSSYPQRGASLFGVFPPGSSILLLHPQCGDIFHEKYALGCCATEPPNNAFRILSTGMVNRELLFIHLALIPSGHHDYGLAGQRKGRSYNLFQVWTTVAIGIASVVALKNAININIGIGVFVFSSLL
ncbi:hypothetical protein RSAG8_10105, partial [Rhizoctonia solani AG-8 WAC10335]